jgi:hypothetical protein
MGTLLEERRSHRRTVIRKAAMYTPGAILAIVLLGISIWSIVGGSYGAAIPAFLLSLIGLALTFEAIAALRDLVAAPETTSGIIRRAWTKRMWLGLFRSHYVLVSKNVFDISIVSYSQVAEGDNLEVVHWPHSKVVVSVTKLRGEAPTRLATSPSPPVEPPDSTGMPVAPRDGDRWKFRDAWRPKK